MAEAVGLCLPLTVPAVTNPANFVLMKSQTGVACAVGMGFLQGIRPAAGTLLPERGREHSISKNTVKK